MFHYKIAIICASTLTLAACGGGGGGGGKMGNIPTKPSMSYLELANSAETRYERIESKYPEIPSRENNYESTARTVNMPTTGSANYNGDIGVSIGDGVRVNYNGEVMEYAPQVAAQGTLRADFARKTMTGKIDNFVPAPGHTSTGSEISYEGKISGNRTQGSWSGNVNFDGVNHQFTNAKEENGSFVGDQAAALEIDAYGVTTRGEEVEIDGVFEKNGKLGK